MKNPKRLLALFCGIAIIGGSVALADDPKVKSQKEAQAFQAMQQTLQSSQDPGVQLKAIEDFLDKFADTQFKVVLLENAMQLAQAKGDSALATTYAERLLEADPKSFEADVAIATMTAQGAKEFDLDKAEKTAKVQKYAQAALTNSADYPKPLSQLPDEKWADQKKSAQAQAYLAMGMMAMVNKKYDEAITDYSKANELYPDTTSQFRLGEAYMKAGKYDEATAAFDKVLAASNVPPQVRQYAQQRKAETARLKAAASK